MAGYSRDKFAVILLEWKCPPLLWRQGLGSQVTGLCLLGERCM
jgi:hypothetical protein